MLEAAICLRLPASCTQRTGMTGLPGQLCLEGSMQHLQVAEEQPASCSFLVWSCVDCSTMLTGVLRHKNPELLTLNS